MKSEDINGQDRNKTKNTTKAESIKRLKFALLLHLLDKKEWFVFVNETTTQQHKMTSWDQQSIFNKTVETVCRALNCQRSRLSSKEHTLLIVEGRTVTYSCSCLCHFGLLWTVVSLAIIPHLLFYIYNTNQTPLTKAFLPQDSINLAVFGKTFRNFWVLLALQLRTLFGLFTFF